MACIIRKGLHYFLYDSKRSLAQKLCTLVQLYSWDTIYTVTTDPFFLTNTLPDLRIKMLTINESSNTIRAVRQCEIHLKETPKPSDLLIFHVSEIFLLELPSHSLLELQYYFRKMVNEKMVTVCVLLAKDSVLRSSAAEDVCDFIWN